MKTDQFMPSFWGKTPRYKINYKQNMWSALFAFPLCLSLLYVYKHALLLNNQLVIQWRPNNKKIYIMITNQCVVFVPTFPKTTTHRLQLVMDSGKNRCCQFSQPLFRFWNATVVRFVKTQFWLFPEKLCVASLCLFSFCLLEYFSWPCGFLSEVFSLHWSKSEGKCDAIKNAILLDDHSRSSYSPFSVHQRVPAFPPLNNNSFVLVSPFFPKKEQSFC